MLSWFSDYCILIHERAAWADSSATLLIAVGAAHSEYGEGY